MRYKRRFDDTFFPAEVLADAISRLEAIDAKKNDNWMLTSATSQEKWWHDTIEELFADYRKRPDEATMSRSVHRDLGLTVSVYRTDTVVEVQAVDRVEIESVYSIFEAARESSKLPAQPTPKPGELMASDALELIQMDHTLADVIIVDSQHRRPKRQARPPPRIVLFRSVARYRISAQTTSLVPRLPGPHKIRRRLSAGSGRLMQGM